MSDNIKTIRELKETVYKFVEARDWQKFHNPKDLSMYIAIESAELMEKFLWMSTEASKQELNNNRQEIENELADVLITSISFANISGIDIFKIVEEKLALNNKKYSLEKSKELNDKYTKYQ